MGIPLRPEDVNPVVVVLQKFAALTYESLEFTYEHHAAGDKHRRDETQTDEVIEDDEAHATPVLWTSAISDE